MLLSIEKLPALAVSIIFLLALGFVSVLPAVAQEPPTAGAAQTDARAALAEILRDEESRNALIAELDQLSSTADVAPPANPSQVSLARQIAVTTQGAVQGIAGGASSAWSALQRAPETLGAIGPTEIAIVFDALRDLLMVIASTIVAFVILRALAARLYDRMGRKARDGTMAARWLIFLASGIIDAAVVLIAWAIGYGLAATVIGQFGEIAIRQSLYLNAFLVVEMAKVIVRLVISPAASDLRPLPVKDEGARRLYGTLNMGISLIGYGLLLVVPIVNANASPAAATSVASAVVLLTAFYLGIAAIRRREPVATWLLSQGRTPVPEPMAPTDGLAPIEGDVAVETTTSGDLLLAKEPRKPGLYTMAARRWHLITLVWLAVVVVIALSQPIARVVDFLKASGLIVVAIFGAVVLSGVLSRAVGKGVSLPGHMTERLPRLETRLNGFVPQILKGIRVAILVAVGLYVLDTAGVFDVSGWLATPQGLGSLGTIASVLAIVGFAFLLWLALTSWVEYRLNPDFGRIATTREQTLLTLLRNALTIVLLVISLMFVLSEIGLNIGPLLASAGVLGLAIGFGAQKMVQDVITGVFIQFENAMNVGDVVTAGPVTGVVEKLTIRSVSLRDLHGVYHLVPFSSVDAVSNFTRDFSHYVVDMGVAYREDIEDVKQAMFTAFDELQKDPEQAPNILGDLEWFGLNQFGDSAVILRARIKTLPGKQWGVGRAYNGIVKRIFDEQGIEIPFPHTTLFFGETKKGSTQSLRVEAADLA